MKNKRNRERYIDIYVIILSVSLFTFISLLKYLPGENPVVEVALINTLFLILLASYFFGIVTGLTLSALFVFGYGSIILYKATVMGLSISATSYLWIFIVPFVSIITSYFHRYIAELQESLIIMKKHLNAYSGTDQNTGLLNERMFYYELSRCMSLAKRHGLPLCLMVIKLRYYYEVKRLVGKENMAALLAEIGKVISKSVRFEDEKFTVDSNGTYTIILMADRKGAEEVRERIRSGLYGHDYTPVIGDLYINIDIMAGIAEYDGTVNNALAFKAMAEKDLEYDV